MESLRKVVDSETKPRDEEKVQDSSRESIKALSSVFSSTELEIVRRHGGSLQQGYTHVHDQPDPTDIAPTKKRGRVLLRNDAVEYIGGSEGESEKADSGILTPTDTTHAKLELVYRDVSSYVTGIT